MTNTRGITFASEAQRIEYLADCRADEMRNHTPKTQYPKVMDHDTTLVGMIFYLAPDMKAFRLSKDGSTITPQLL